MKNLVLTLAAAAGTLSASISERSGHDYDHADYVHADQGCYYTRTVYWDHDQPTWEFGLGYQYLRTGQFCAGFDSSTCTSDNPKSFPVGLMLDGVRNWGSVGIVGEVGWSRHDDDNNGDPFADRLTTDIWHAGGGVRWTGRYNKVWPYAQGLAGGASSRFDGVVGGLPFRDNRGRFMAQAGGGVTFVVGDGWGLFVDAPIGACSSTRTRISRPVATTCAASSASA
jgi:hypothetical protein